MARLDGRSFRRLRSGPTRFRTPTLYSLHIGINRKTERGSAHHGRVHSRSPDDDSLGLRRSRRRHILVHGRHRLDHRSQLHHLWTTRKRHDFGHVRRRSQLARRRPLLGTRREVSGQHLLHSSNSDSRIREVGRRVAEQVRPLIASPAGNCR